MGSVIVLDQQLVKSKAWLSLSSIAVQTYLLFRCKCQIAKRSGRPGKRGDNFMERLLNNGELVFTYAEAKRLYGITAPRFSRAIDELVDEKGFIDITATGMGVYKVTTLYAISDRWRLYGTPDYKPPEPRPKRPINRGFQKGNTFGRNYKKKSTDTFVHSAVYKNMHGEILAVYRNVHGRKTANRSNASEDKQL